MEGSATAVASSRRKMILLARQYIFPSQRAMHLLPHHCRYCTPTAQDTGTDHPQKYKITRLFLIPNSYLAACLFLSPREAQFSATPIMRQLFAPRRLFAASALLSISALGNSSSAVDKGQARFGHAPHRTLQTGSNVVYIDAIVGTAFTSAEEGGAQLQVCDTS